jgi:hypothetical protein
LDRKKLNRILPCALIMTLVLLAAMPAFAEIKVGVSGGLARYSFAGDTPEQGAYTQRIRGAAGAVFEMEIYDRIRLSIQPFFVQKGTGIAYEVPGQKERVDSVEVDTDYFSLPVLVKIFTGKERWFVSSGIELAYLLDARYTTSTEDEDVTSDFNNFDAAIHFGVGWTRPAGPHEIFLELRYTQSVKNVISDEDPEGELYGLRLKNNGIMFLAGFLFQL